MYIVNKLENWYVYLFHFEIKQNNAVDFFFVCVEKLFPKKMRGTENLHDLILSIPMYRHVHIIRRRFKSEDLLASQSQKIPRIPPQDFNQAWQFWRQNKFLYKTPWRLKGISPLTILLFKTSSNCILQWIQRVYCMCAVLCTVHFWS